MEEQIKTFIENNDVLKQYLKYPKEELKIMRMYINLELVNIEKEKENVSKMRIIKSCSKKTENYFDYILSYIYKVGLESVSIKDTLEKTKKLNLCEYCKLKNCIRKSVAIFIDEIDKYNLKDVFKLDYLEVIDYILNRKIPEFKEIPEENFFDNVSLIDLMYILIILESDLISISKYNNNIVEYKYLDLTSKANNKYYINILMEYYKNDGNNKKSILDLNELNNIFNEKDRSSRIYSIAAYYKYLIEFEKIDIILKLREILKIDNIKQGMKIRAHYFIYKNFQKVEELPYSNKTKEKIYNILNYILNYRYKDETPFIPINILMYSNDKEGVEKISEIIGEFMWFFGYLSGNMRYYSEYMNNIILDQYQIKKIYFKGEETKEGILLIHNFENLLYTEYMKQNLILNILTDEMERNNNRVCTIIYGEREAMKQILGNHHKLSEMLINLELEIDNLNIDKVYELVIEKLEKNILVTEQVKEKIYNYVKSTYRQSDIQNMGYVNKIYNLIILNMNNTFSSHKKQELTTEHIPEAYNIRDLPTIMKEINALVGLNEIKEQIGDLVAVLKFNKKTNIDIKNFNLHMVFSGNSGTGKTTVGRLITDIFYNLGYINQNKLTEVTAKDLIAEYVGQTAGKTFNVVKSAIGGVLFIDEAYSISTSYNYGDECIATLLKLMEDYKSKLIVIFAGYKDEMEQFEKSNPGLASRIGYKIDFPDYTLEELIQMFMDLLEKNKLTITNEALDKLKIIIKEAMNFENFGNARYINNVFQKILIEHSKNTENKKTDLYKINEEDIKKEKLIPDSKIKKIGF